VFGNSRSFRFIGRGQKSPEQVRNDGEVAAMAVERAVAKDDAKYDAMTQAEREAYYLRSSRFSRLKKWVKG
jgi:hypothetical protein